MKRIILILALLFLPLGVLAQDTETNDQEAGSNEEVNSVDLWFFYQEDCSYCQQAKAFLTELQNENPNLIIKKFEVTENTSNRAIFSLLLDIYGVDDSGVPAFFIGDGFVDGYNQAIANTISQRVEHCKYNECISPSQYMIEYNQSGETFEQEEGNFSWTTFLIFVFGLIILVAIFLPRKGVDEEK